VSDWRNQQFEKQALGYTRAFFVYLHRAYGFIFSDADQQAIALNACRDTANHINKHRIFQRTLDGLKLTSFLAYHAACHVVKTSSHGGGHDPALEACRAGVERLSGLLKLETSNQIVLSSSDCGYLMSMLYAELTDNCEAGIGANGLSTVFTFLYRIRPVPTATVLAGI
jgi:hypothetical protein